MENSASNASSLAARLDLSPKSVAQTTLDIRNAVLPKKEPRVPSESEMRAAYDALQWLEGRGKQASALKFNEDTGELLLVVDGIGWHCGAEDGGVAEAVRLASQWWGQRKAKLSHYSKLSSIRRALEAADPVAGLKRFEEYEAAWQAVLGAATNDELYGILQEQIALVEQEAAEKLGAVPVQTLPTA